MSKIYFNQLEVTIQEEQIDRDFTILKFSRDDYKLSYYNLAFLDQLMTRTDEKALSVCFEWGREAYVLFDQKTFKSSVADLRTAIGDEAIRVEKISVGQIPWRHKVLQLFLNACGSSQHPRYRFSNLTGRLYITAPEKAFHNRKDQSRIALEVLVRPHFVIALETVTLTSLARYQDLIKNKYGIPCDKEKQKIDRLPWYVFEPAQSSFRRHFRGEEIPFKQLYVRRRPPMSLRKGTQKKHHIDFFSLNPKKYPDTKVALFNELLYEQFEPRYGAYFTISQPTLEKGVCSRQMASKGTVGQQLKEVPIRLIDHTGDQKQLKEVQQLLKETYGLNYRMTKNVKEGCLNIQFNHDKAYYLKGKHGVDPYRPASLDCAVQNFTLQEFRDNGSNQVSKTLQEGHLKYDISRRQLSIFDWKQLCMDRDWYFALAEATDDEPIFHFLVIDPAGKLTFSTLSRDLFNQTFHDKMAQVYRGGKISKMSPIEGIIFDGDGNINTIERTDLRTFPQLQQVHTYLMRGTELNGNTISSMQIAQFTEQFIHENGSSEAIQAILEQAKRETPASLPLQEMKDQLKGRQKINADYAIAFRRQFGYWLKHPVKNKAQVSQSFAAMVDIHSLQQDKSLLFWANKGMGQTKGEFATSNVVRRLKPWHDSALLFDQLLATMDVDFVRVDGPSVIPFPFKLLREYMRMAERPHGGIDFGGFDFGV